MNVGFKKKVGTVLDEELFQEIKELSARLGIPLNQLIETALEKYIQEDKNKGLLSLEEALEAEPASRSAEGKGREGSH